MGQPGVVSETTTSTRPSSAIWMDRTMPSSTIDRRSSGSITAVRASVICSLVGVGTASIVTNALQTTIDRRFGRSIGEERLLFCPRGCCGQIPPGRHLSRRPGLRDSDERGHPLGNRGLRPLEALLGLGAVLLDRGLDLAPALLDLALEPVTGLPRAGAGLAPRLGAAPLELV